MSDIFFRFCFFSLEESTFETGKNVYNFTSKAPYFLRYSNFRMWEPTISWRHQMSNHETRNTFYWIIFEVNTVW